MFIFFAALTCLMVLVIYLDATRYIIPNWLNGLVAILFPLMVLMSPVPVQWKMALACMLVVFLIGNIIFWLKLMGGGDIKLFAVASLWVGQHGYAKNMEYVMVVALLGGALSVALLLLRRMAPLYYGRGEGKVPPRLLQPGAPVPYGIAIAVAFLGYLWTGAILPMQ